MNPELLGVPQGMGVYHVSVAIYNERDGWAGSRHCPTFWVVGGNAHDAINNTLTILNLSAGRPLPTGETVTGVRIDVRNADAAGSVTDAAWYQSSTGRVYSGETSCFLDHPLWPKPVAACP